MNGTHGTLFCVPGLFVLLSQGYFCVGMYRVIYVYQCHTCVPVSYMCTSATWMCTWCCHGVSGVPATNFWYYFTYDFLSLWCSPLTYYSKQTWYLFIYLSDLVASCLAYYTTLLGVERQHWWWLWDVVGLKDLSEIFSIMTVALRL
jgi:hypothetical protein